MMFRSLAAALFALPLLAGSAAAADKVHQVVVQVDEGDPLRMNLALNNAVNIVRSYQKRLEDVQVRIVTFGPGIAMVRAGSSPVEQRVLATLSSVPEITFNVCDNTLAAIKASEGLDVPIIAGVKHVESGAAAVVELEEQGWSYLRP